MPKYKALTLLIHNNEEFAKGSILELSTEEANHLIKIGCIEHTREEIIPGQESRIVEKFSAPASTAEIEKSVNSAVLAPIKRGKCPKCKVQREIKNPQVMQDDKKDGVIHIIGECAICGTRISRISGRVKVEEKK